jgi:hypothetical protein
MAVNGRNICACSKMMEYAIVHIGVVFVKKDFLGSVI